MKIRLGLICLGASIALAQSENGNVLAKVKTLPIQPGTVALLHLAAGYTTSISLPDEISSVVVGDPVTFKAEHSEAEPRLVFFKPTTTLPSETNALITTKLGQEISLYLVSEGKPESDTPVDFLVEYRRPHALVISSSQPSFLVPETRSLSSDSSIELNAATTREPEALASALEQQKASPPAWVGQKFRAAIGKSVAWNGKTILAFSILNDSPRSIEILPPELELSEGAQTGKRITAAPIPISGYRITSRRLASGQRADGVVTFERPTFKESAETLQLRLAQADQVDRPLLLQVPFTPEIQGGEQ